MATLRRSLAALIGAAALVGTLPVTMTAGAAPVPVTQGAMQSQRATPRSVARSWWAAKPNGGKVRRTRGQRDASLRSRANRRKVAR